MKAYDEGFEDEAQRIATVLRTLFHDGRNSNSLLSQLDLKNQIYLNSSINTYVPTNEIAYTGLLTNRLSNSKGEYIPAYEGGGTSYNKWFRFSDWWNELVIDDKHNLFTREDIVRKISDTDGGAHVDNALDEEYAKLTVHNSLGWHYERSGEQIPFERNPAYGSARQIASEVIESIELHQLTIVRGTRIFFEEMTAHYIGKICYFYRTPPIDVFFTDKRVSKVEKRKSMREQRRLHDGRVIEILILV